MNETEMIEMFGKIHGVTPFSADAECFGGMLYSTDSFSKTEDFF